MEVGTVSPPPGRELVAAMLGGEGAVMLGGEGAAMAPGAGGVIEAAGALGRGIMLLTLGEATSRASCFFLRSATSFIAPRFASCPSQAR